LNPWRVFLIRFLAICVVGKQRKFSVTHCGGDAGDIAPAPERLAQAALAGGAVERLDKPIADGDGRVARPYRHIDLLPTMERRGSITAAMRDAGEDFRAQFARARFDPLHAANLLRAGAPNRGAVGLGAPPLRTIDAQQRTWNALVAVGGPGSAGGSCLWHVVGLEQTLKQWALEQGWNGRRVSQEAASGILIAALGALEAHYNGPRRGRAH
jgi:hypothetical protein